MVLSGINTVKHAKKIEIFGTSVLMSIFILRLFMSAPMHSVTFDEYAYVPAGYSYWKTGDFRLYENNPPLIKLWNTLPLLFSSPSLSYSPSGASVHPWKVGFLFLKDNFPRYQNLFLQCRAMVIILSSVFGLLLFLWARSLYGWKAGIACLGCYTFLPETLAHSQLCTTDLGGAFFAACGLAGLWLYLKAPTMKRVTVCGVLLGAALLAKGSNVLLYAVYTLAIAGFLRERRWSRKASDFALMLLVSVFVINLGYVFQGTMRSLGSFKFMSRGMGIIQNALPASLPLPFPSPLIEGIDLDQNEVEVGHLAFLNGSLSIRTRWYYFLEAFILKTPIPFIVFIACRFFKGYGRKFSRRNPGDAVLLLGAIMYLVNFSALETLDIGIRFILPVYPLLSVWISPMIFHMTTWWTKGLYALMFGWLAVSSLSIHPHYLSYFNEIAGGPEGGKRYLGDSNIDWGQDLPQLKKYMDNHGLKKVTLFYYGVVDPAVYGIRYDVPSSAHTSELKGDIAVSVSLLQGKGVWGVPTVDGRNITIQDGALLWLNRFRPVGRAGYSIYIFRL